MKPRWAALLLLSALVLLVPTAAGLGGHYIPQSGDRFVYYETIVLNGGTGDYQGYTENSFINGSIAVTAVQSNGTESASYDNTDHWENNQGSQETVPSSGTFTFSASTFLYVQGTDNQTGYTNPYVWFYMNNSLGAGQQFYLLNSAFNVVSTDYAFELSPGSYVKTIFAEGNGSYQRDDVYGILTADYNWKAYFDVGTGYIVGYLYTEHDSNSSGDGFTWTDQLGVTSTSYTLTPTSAPPSGSSSGVTTTDLEIIGVVVVVIVLVVIGVWLAARRRPRPPPRLPQHAAPGSIPYGAPPPPVYAGGPGAPPVHLTPSGQPVPQVVLRETVKVPCRYCGNLIDVTDKVCPNCGAPLT